MENDFSVTEFCSCSKTSFPSRTKRFAVHILTHIFQTPYILGRPLSFVRHYFGFIFACIAHVAWNNKCGDGARRRCDHWLVEHAQRTVYIVRNEQLRISPIKELLHSTTTTATTTARTSNLHALHTAYTSRSLFLSSLPLSSSLFVVFFSVYFAYKMWYHDGQHC